MKINRVMMKRAAKNCMGMAKCSPYAIGTLYVVITFILSIFLSYVTGRFSTLTVLPDQTVISVPSPVAVFISVLIALVCRLLYAGITMYCLGIRKGKRMELMSLFDGFSFAGRVILLYIAMGFLIFVGCIAFLIPGIILSYRYSFALFNLLEVPGCGVIEAMRMSAEQTRGIKMDLFFLDLSFLGWHFLNFLLMSFLSIWLVPYYTLTYIAYYDTVRARVERERQKTSETMEIEGTEESEEAVE